MAKKLLVSDISNTIYLANAKQDKNNPNLFITTGEKQDFTDEAIKAVFQWFMNNHKDNEPNKLFQVTFASSPYVLQMVKKEDLTKEQNNETN